MDSMMEIKKKRRVMVGTPCYDGSIDVWYVNSLVNTVKLAEEMNVEIIPIWVSYDALVQRARNDTIALVRELDCDDIIFIDNDIEWEPEWFYRLLNYPVDIVGGTYPKKGETELYVAKMEDPYAAKDPVTNLLEVDGLGTGFLRFSRRAVDAIWDASPVYVELDQNKNRRWVFEVVVENGGLISEDIHLCRKLKKLGFKTWLDTSITCNHIGFKKYTGNFDAWLAKTRPTAAPTTTQTPPAASCTSYGNNYLNKYVNNKGI
jgi:hypothetical protein